MRGERVRGHGLWTARVRPFDSFHRERAPEGKPFHRNGIAPCHATVTHVNQKSCGSWFGVTPPHFHWALGLIAA